MRDAECLAQPCAVLVIKAGEHIGPLHGEKPRRYGDTRTARSYSFEGFDKRLIVTLDNKTIERYRVQGGGKIWVVRIYGRPQPSSPLHAPEVAPIDALIFASKSSDPASLVVSQID
ncbi:MAG TPA: hypothetical protein VMU80_16320 [Bryobacteraceae bacterium]|nr:hypothetical protein [Bryobacteraceae bacterium]HUO30792.1 hypothetical protein [Bryobacteraceae bacterium]